MLISKPILTQSNQDKLLIIKTDILEYTIKYSLLQTLDYKMHLIAYNSQKLTSAEISYLIHRKKLLAIKLFIGT